MSELKTWCDLKWSSFSDGLLPPHKNPHTGDVWPTTSSVFISSPRRYLCFQMIRPLASSLTNPISRITNELSGALPRSNTQHIIKRLTANSTSEILPHIYVFDWVEVPQQRRRARRQKPTFSASKRNQRFFQQLVWLNPLNDSKAVRKMQHKQNCTLTEFTD